MKRVVRNGMMALGRKVSPTALSKAGNLIRDLELEVWLKRHGCVEPRMFSRREELFHLVGSEVGEQPVLYLEFGVAKGDATREWSKILKHPETILHGFDSFEGLPENWTPDRPKGMFSTGGNLPEIKDARVQFFKGWFEQTLPSYVPPHRDINILNLDADLYSSTILVMRKLKHLIRPGTYLYFDEFSSYGHEERAFREYVEENNLKFKLRGVVGRYMHVLFQCV